MIQNYWVNKGIRELENVFMLFIVVAIMCGLVAYPDPI